jgi:hypothetical protein
MEAFTVLGGLYVHALAVRGDSLPTSERIGDGSNADGRRSLSLWPSPAGWAECLILDAMRAGS